MGDIREPAPKPSLSTEINTSTRVVHAELNKLITARIPLALPPHAKDTSLYALGLSVFARIYIGIEEALDSLAHEHPLERRDHSRAVVRWLITLRSHGLARKSRLQYDLQSLGARSPPSRAQVALGTIGDNIDNFVYDKPHALIAYMWVMYMAIFSGGRHIREELSRAGPGFWPSPKSFASMGSFSDLSRPGYTFLSFDGDDNGEAIKVEFKARLAEGDALLTVEERREAVEAADELFGLCIDIVSALDEEAKERAEVRWSWLLGVGWLGAAIVGIYLARSLWR
ncbi:hypothetical protein B0A48_01307 [Cryoendolithus antarcticus]|uniref:Heme oxygenase-like protein n=1 Tax=Cryoendolithus antarcticus TaxID=1507870 RepID=A0A1V8TSU3_9PEZI|nr:hypothetical protein B0A48_01307 [Cryoendolithus antarcticus]